MKKVLLRTQVFAIILVVLVMSSVFFNVRQAWAFDEAAILSMSNVEDVAILENGDAQVTLLINVAGSTLAEMYRKMLAAPSDAGVGEEMPIPENKTENGVVIPVREEFYKSIKQEQKSSLGFATWILGSSMVPRGEQDECIVSINAYASLHVANVTAVGSDGIWEIVVGPKDENATAAAAGLVFTMVAFAQQMLGSLEGDQVYEISKTVKIRVPEGATILNGDELAGLSWTLSLGGGTFMSASVSVDDSSTVILNERTVVTEQNITVTPMEIFEAFHDYKVFTIKYLFPGHAVIGGESDWASESDWSCSWSWPWSASFPMEWTYTYGGAQISAKLTITPSFTLSGYLGWDFNWHGGLEWFKAWIGASASLKVKLEVTATAEITKTWEQTLFEVTLYRFTFTIDYVPVWIDLDLSLIASLSAGADAKVSFTIEADVGASFKGGVKYDDGWSAIKEADTYAHLTGPTITSAEGSAWIEPSLKFRISFLVYSVSGPYLEFQPYIRGTLTYYVLEEFGTWEITTGFRLNAGVTFKGWLKDLLGLSDHYFTLYDWTIKEWSGHWGQAKSRISISLDPSSINLGAGTVVSGKIESEYSGYSLRGTVHIEYSSDEGSTWNTLVEKLSKADGSYSYWWFPSSSGSYQVRSYWGGNQEYKAATCPSVLTLEVSTVISPVDIVRYDDGDMESSGSEVFDHGLAVRFTAPSTLWNLDRIWVYGNYGENPGFEGSAVAHGATFRVEVWDINLNLLWSGSYPYTYFDRGGDPASDWRPFDIPNIVVSGDFYVVVVPNALEYWDYAQQKNICEYWLAVGIDIPDQPDEYAGRDYRVYSNAIWGHPNIVVGHCGTTLPSGQVITCNLMIRAEGMSLVEDHYMYRELLHVPFPSNIVRTNTFYIDDDYAYSRVEFRPELVSAGTFVNWLWYNPDGSVYRARPGTCDGASATARLPIEGNRAFYEQYLDRPFKVEIWLYTGPETGMMLALTETFIVTKHESSIGIDLSSNSITYGQSTRISSQIWEPRFPVDPGTTTLQYSTDQITWNNIVSGSPSFDGYYSYNWAPPHAGTYYIRAVWSGNDNYYGNTSSTITLTVNPAPTLLTTTLSANTITYGSTITITASMTPALQGRNVTIQYSDDSITWYTLDLGTTDSAGQYACSWNPPNVGTYYIRSTWYGEADYLGANSISQQLTVEPGHPTQIEIINGANAEVDRTPDATVEFAVKVKDLVTGQYLSGTGRVEFYVSDQSHYNIIFAGADTDNDADGIYNFTWTANANWPTLGPQHWSAWFTGTPQHMPSLESTDFTIYYYGAALWIDPTFQAVKITQTTAYTINFKWNRDTTDTFTLSLTGLNPSWYTLSQTSITVSSKGQTEQVTLTISPPKAPTILKDYDFTVTATNATSFSVSTSATVRVGFTPTLPASPTGGLAIAVQPKTTYMSAGTTVTVNILVINNQNFDDVITVDISNSGIPSTYQANITWFDWTRVKVFIPAGSRISIPLQITVPSGTPNGMYIFKTIATSTTNLATNAKDSGIIKVQ